MPTIDDVYRKFGEVAEAAQLLETDLGTALLFLGAVDEGLITPTFKVDAEGATDLMRRINRQTLGQLIRNTKQLADELAQIEPLLADALEQRNRLAHSFYRQHNLRKCSDSGRAIMLKDLESMHNTLLAAWKAVNLLSGIDLEAFAERLTKTDDNSDGDTLGLEDRIVHLPI
jgi:hypothetical protein